MPINPLYAWIELLQSRPAVTALVATSRIKFDLDAVEVPPQNAWLIVSAGVPMGVTERRTWLGSIRFTAFAPERSFYQAQQVIDAIVDDLWDPRSHWARYRLGSGSQEGAVISIHDVYGLGRTRQPLSGDIYYPAWQVEMATQVSEEALAWSS